MDDTWICVNVEGARVGWVPGKDADEAFEFCVKICMTEKIDHVHPYNDDSKPCEKCEEIKRGRDGKN